MMIENDKAGNISSIIPTPQGGGLERLFAATTGSSPADIYPLSGAASARRYFRLTGAGTTLIGVMGTSVAENRAFIRLAAHFAARGLRVPRVVAVSDDEMSYLQTDLGSISLYDRITACHRAKTWDEATIATLRQVMTDLADLQCRGAEGLDFSVCTPQTTFDRRTVMWDLNYFKYCFLKPSGTDFDEGRVEDDFCRLADDLLEADGLDATPTFMYRDFQSRNVMISNGEPWYIDFQGGRRGPVYYDVASFLWQARAAYPDALREELLQCYMRALGAYREVREEAFRARLARFVLFRLMQVLGTYGFRGYIERKAMFVVTIPAAIASLAAHVRKHDFSRYPYLVETLLRMADNSRFAITDDEEGLTVRVMSFSYRKGIPDDLSGNGGGFVFDCRAVENPGRYDEYKALNGRDEAVRHFFEADGGIVAYLDYAYAMVDNAVATYMKRGFTSLMVNFGCTGGRHRSVYAAQHMAEHIARKYPVRVLLTHRELGIQEMISHSPLPAPNS